MRNFILATLLISHAALANTLYSRLSECSLIDGARNKTIRVTYVGEKNTSNSELIEKSKLMLYKKIKHKLNDYPEGLMERSVTFIQYDIEPKVEAVAKLRQVKSCENAQYIIDEDNIQLLTTVVSKPVQANVKMEKHLQMPDTIYHELPERELVLKVGQNQQLGLTLGNSFQDALERVGRFSFVWSINETDKIALIGRDHAFSFRDNKYVGYQYNEALLPMSLRNHLELAAETFEIITPKIKFESHHFLSLDKQELLSKQFSNVSFMELGAYDDEYVEKKLAGFTIGEPLNFKKMTKLACYQSNIDINTFIEQQTQHLISLVDNHNRPAYLTGCHQKLVLANTGRVQLFELIDEFSSERSTLIGMSVLTNSLSPWEFSQISQGDNISKLAKHKSVTIEWDTAKFSSTDWQGHLYLYDDKVFTGKLTPSETP